VGTVGGILVGLNDRKFEALAWQDGKYCVVMIKNSYDKFVWRLVVVYGSPYEEGKSEFLQELENILGNWDGPTVFRSLEGTCELILLSYGHRDTIGRSIYNIKKSFYCLSDCWTHTRHPALCV
jgi:hypothetical protein